MCVAAVWCQLVLLFSSPSFSFSFSQSSSFNVFRYFLLFEIFFSVSCILLLFLPFWDPDVCSSCCAMPSVFLTSLVILVCQRIRLFGGFMQEAVYFFYHRASFFMSLIRTWAERVRSSYVYRVCNLVLHCDTWYLRQDSLEILDCPVDLLSLLKAAHAFSILLFTLRVIPSASLARVILALLDIRKTIFFISCFRLYHSPLLLPSISMLIRNSPVSVHLFCIWSFV